LLSSAAVYGNPASLPVTEQHAVSPLSPYGYHKRQAELLCEEFSRIYGLSTVCARIFSAYGPGLRRQVVWDICEKVLTTGQLALRGTGGQTRDFVHAADIAHGLHLLATAAPGESECYNLASGREVTVAELVAILLRALGSSLRPAFDGRDTPGDPLRWQADIAKIAALGFSPAIPLEQGLHTVATWCSAELSRL
jgi:UDP-glucose 4-epimerase